MKQAQVLHCKNYPSGLILKPGPRPWTRTQKNLDPEKPWPCKTWTQKNLDPEKPGPWKTWTSRKMWKIGGCSKKIERPHWKSAKRALQQVIWSFWRLFRKTVNVNENEFKSDKEVRLCNKLDKLINFSQ